MKSEKSNSQLQFLAPSLREMLDPKNSFYRLAEMIDWTGIEAELSPLYADFPPSPRWRFQREIGEISAC